MEGGSDSPASVNNESEKCKTEVAEEQEDEYVQIDYSNLEDELQSYINEVENSLATKTVLLNKNSNAASEHLSIDEVTKRDPSVKKNSAFIKKVRNFGASQIELLIKECQGLNMTKYLSEAATAIVEAKIKFTDIPALVLFCTEMNCTYPEFASFLQEECIKVLSVNKNEPIINANRLRVDLCFYAELSLCGVIRTRQSLPVLGTALKALTADKTFNTLSIILSFCKHCGSDFAGLVPRRIRLLLDQFGKTLSSSTLLASSKQDIVKNLLCDYYSSLWEHIHNEQMKLSSYEQKNRQILMAKGELRPDRTANVEVMRSEIQSLLSGAVTLAELLDLELPDMPETDMQDMVIGDEDECIGTHLWEDEETRLFYTQLPDVKKYLSQLNKQEEVNDKSSSTNESNGSKTDDAESPNKKQAFESFLKLLHECDSKEMIDNAALEFLLYFNTKSCRKKLIITLFMVPRSKRVLVALYARFLAILNPVVPEVVIALCQQLKSEMLRRIHKKDQVNVESKKNTVKFIAELVNFGLFNKKDVMKVLRLLLSDFTHHNIEMACSLLECCGCVLYAASDTHFSTKYYLDQMMRLKTMMPLESRYVTLIETTYYTILPPESASIPEAPNLTPMQKFIAKLIYQDLRVPGSETTIFRLLRSLDWNNEEIALYTVTCLTSAYNVSFFHIRTLASIVSMLADHEEDMACRVVDGVIEDIRLGMELNASSLNQRRVSMVKYLGELYNYRMMDTWGILRVLYSLLAFGTMQHAEDMTPLDPPTSVIRIHLILVLLNTCAFPLFNGDTKTKLKYYFTYFQHYYWLKRALPVWCKEQPFPVDIIYRFEDVIISICPKFVLAKNLDEATFAVKNLNSKMFSEATQEDAIMKTVFEDCEESVDGNTCCEEGNELLETNSDGETQTQKKEEADEEFIQEFNQMFLESVKASDGKSTKRNVDISIPLSYKKAIESDKPQFALLLKKGNKQTFKTLTLPPDHEYITSLNSRKEASRLEKEQFKKLTLDINERQQEDI